MKHVGFVGLGVMGFPMAGHLYRSDYSVVVFNRNPEKSQHWTQTHNGIVASSPAQLASQVEMICLCVGNDNDIRHVIAGPEGLLEGIRPGTIVVDHTTASAQVAGEMADLLAEKGCHFIDAPVSGGQSGAENGTLTVMCGGEQPIFKQVVPVISCYARAVTLLGPVGSGQRCKMVNQICIAGLLQGLSEGLHFAQLAGLDPAMVIEVISKGAAQSWQMENRHKTMIAGEYEHGFAVDWMRKDLAIVLEEARDNGARLPVTALVDQFYADIQANGGGRWDTSSLLTRLHD